MSLSDRPIVTRAQLVSDLTGLGIEAGDVVMFHASVKAIGWVVGGPDVVIQALLDVVGAKGTLMMYVSVEEPIYDLPTLSEAARQAYLANAPAFDPNRTRAHRKWSILTEYLRTWPGAMRSANPEAGVAAVGAKARWLTADHPLQYGYGVASPFEKLVQLSGKVLMLGAPLDTITLLHHAEHLANIPNKRIVSYQWPIERDGKRVWVNIEEFDTSRGIVDWAHGDTFEAIGKAFLGAGHGRSGKVGDADSHVFDAQSLVGFGVKWFEDRFA